MRCGISTACFYPEETKIALQRVVDLGAPVTEIFINSFGELEDEYVAILKKIIDTSGIQISSVHPFTSPLEGLLFATDYKGRLEDGFTIYRRYFEVCNLLGADKLIFHGDNKMSPYSLEGYAVNIKQLVDVGKTEYNVQLCYENVVYCRLGDPAKVRKIRPLLGENACFTLDLKQARRKGAKLQDMMQAMQGRIKQVHISDYDLQSDCIPPGLGTFDFSWLLTQLKQQNYNGDLIIELYRDGFHKDAQLAQALKFIQTLLEQMNK